MASEAPEDDPKKHGRRLTDEQHARIRLLATEGHTAVSIAQQIGCSRQAVDYILKKYVDARPLALQRIQALSLDAIEQWQKAAEIAAAKGDHKPAKELAEAAMPELRPQQAASGNVIIALGQPGAALPAGLEPPAIEAVVVK
jgi:hypothetical protein